MRQSVAHNTPQPAAARDHPQRHGHRRSHSALHLVCCVASFDHSRPFGRHHNNNNNNMLAAAIVATHRLQAAPGSRRRHCNRSSSSSSNGHRLPLLHGRQLPLLVLPSKQLRRGSRLQPLQARGQRASLVSRRHGCFAE
jgi:hypothetical protein